jgi:hypothetical protein
MEPMSVAASKLEMNEIPFHRPVKFAAVPCFFIAEQVLFAPSPRPPA